MVGVARRSIPHYNLAAMEPLPVDIFQLQRRDPMAWSALLSRAPETGDGIVTAVTAEPLCSISLIPSGRLAAGPAQKVRRYLLTLAGCSDPISFIVKQTNAAEAALYQTYGRPPATAVPTCLYAHIDGDESYVIIDDVPDHFPAHSWTPRQVEEIVATMTRIHAAHWNRDGRQLGDWATAGPLIPHFHRLADGGPAFDEARDLSRSKLLTGGDSAFDSEHLSAHGLRAAGRLAPRFAQAAAGLSVMRSLNGWPGVLGQSHLTAAADLLDDPIPMLAPLLDLPVTLLHGSPHPCHWRLTLFDECYLVDWSEVQEGPGVLDLMAFIEGYPLVHDHPLDGSCSFGDRHVHLRPMTPLIEETIVDTYLLTLAAELGGRAGARAFRAALPAARCFHTLLKWFPFFATWAADMPDPYLWQHVNRLDDVELSRYQDAPTAGMRLYLAGVFERFLRAYRSL